MACLIIFPYYYKCPLITQRTAAAKVPAELDTHLKDPVYTKTVRQEFHKSNIHGTAAIAKSLITVSNSKRRKR
jgi:hypothetical protein